MPHAQSRYGEDWPKYYTVEPSNFTGGDAADAKGLVGGVEVCMWSEFVDGANFIPRMWARAASVSERGWSAKTVTDVDDARERLHEFRCKLIERGIPAEPITNGGASIISLAHCLPIASNQESPCPPRNQVSNTIGLTILVGRACRQFSYDSDLVYAIMNDTVTLFHFKLNILTIVHWPHTY